jgi:chemotaxis-related protein WspD
VTPGCWARIGVYGDGSCQELATHIHCRECPVYARAAHARLDAPLSPDDIAERTRHFAQLATAEETELTSVLLFRLASEWFGAPTTVVHEVADARSVHMLPHRRASAVTGVTNVRGELLVCVSLDRVLHVERTAPPVPVTASRLVVLRRGEIRAAGAVDEVFGVHRFSTRDRRPVPATVAKSHAPLCSHVIGWRGRTVGVLDDHALFGALQRAMA